MKRHTIKKVTDKQRLKAKDKVIHEIKKDLHENWQGRLQALRDYGKLEESFEKLQAINTELKAEVDTLRNQVTAYSHSNEFKEGQIKAYEKILKIYEEPRISGGDIR